MKKKNIINLIKYYSEGNDIGFRNEAYEIAKDFDAAGDYQLSEYIMALMSSANTFIPQMDDTDSCFFERVKIETMFSLSRKLSSRTLLVSSMLLPTMSESISSYSKELPEQEKPKQLSN